MKRCPSCNTVKPSVEFYRNVNTKDGHTCYCKKCQNTKNFVYRFAHPESGRKATRKWQQFHPEKAALYESRRDRRAKGLKIISKKYGERALELKAAKTNCAICGDVLGDTMARRSNSACVDHCHGCGFVRDILCRVCNVGLGAFCDDPRLLRAAAAYLEAKACDCEKVS